mgnify:CR=1 FL=1
MEFFGYKFEKIGKQGATEKSFVAPSDDTAVETIRAGGYYGTYLDLDGTATTENDLILKYREIAMMADVDIAIEDIVNEAMANLDNEDPVAINLEQTNLSSSLKKNIETEFKFLLSLLNFNIKSHDLFKRWYIDGRIAFHKVIDTAKKTEGIKDLRYIDPRKIKKVREIKKEKDPRTGVEFIKSIDEYFLYNERGIAQKSTTTTTTGSPNALRVTKDSIAYCPSGLVDQDKNIPLSYLHKAIRPANQLRMMENALVIYRITRAPERRIFYVDVGNLPKLKAEQYLKDLMTRYRNKLVYDSSTGEIRDDKKFMSMLEDFWLPRREGGKGTQIETLPGGQNLGEITDVEYFQRKLYQALNVPLSRFQNETNGFNFGRVAEINRDEIKFAKFVSKLRRRFGLLFDDILKTHLILKNVITENDWTTLKEQIRYDFKTDLFYAETKDQELLKSRVDLLSQVAEYVGVFYSKKYVMKEILKLTEDQIKEMEKQMAKEPPLPINEPTAKGD